MTIFSAMNVLMKFVISIALSSALYFSEYDDMHPVCILGLTLSLLTHKSSKSSQLDNWWMIEAVDEAGGILTHQQDTG